MVPTAICLGSLRASRPDPSFRFRSTTRIDLASLRQSLRSGRMDWIPWRSRLLGSNWRVEVVAFSRRRRSRMMARGAHSRRRPSSGRMTEMAARSRLCRSRRTAGAVPT